MSAMPIGMPGWPDLAASTASIESIRIALARRRRGGRGEEAALSLRRAMAFLFELLCLGRSVATRVIGRGICAENRDCRLTGTGRATKRGLGFCEPVPRPEPVFARMIEAPISRLRNPTAA